MEQNDRKEDIQTLSTLLKQDEDMVAAQLSSDRSAQRAVEILEKETDRLMYRAGTFDAEQAGMAQTMLQVLKNALPLITSVSEVETWKKESEAASSRMHVPASSVVCGITGLVCVIAGMIGSPAFAGFTRIFQVLWLLAGCVLMIICGYLAGRGRKADRKGQKAGASGKEAKELNRQQTFLVDTAKVWHILQGTLLGADHSLETAREHSRIAEQNDQANGAGGMQKADLQFFSDLLENTYARRRQSPSDEALTEQVETIRYYLHERGIETEDYSQQSAKWFEMLPAGEEAVTIRPAFLRDGVVIMKGVASGRA